ncbi:MAG: hypothetical protein ACHQYQ_03395 [Bacteriovoracales bacterium]
MYRILFLIFFISCNQGPSTRKEAFPTKLNATDHLKEAKEMLRQEEGQLMIVGRNLSEKEKVRYETLIDSGKKLDTIIDLLEKTQ